MNKASRFLAGFAALNGAMGVALLSLAAHQADNETAARILHSGGLIQLLHALAALIALSRNAMIPTGLFVLGSTLFAAAMSFLIYLPDMRIPAMAPLGGGLLIVGWFLLAITEFRQKT